MLLLDAKSYLKEHRRLGTQKSKRIKKHFLNISFHDILLSGLNAFQGKHCNAYITPFKLLI